MSEDRKMTNPQFKSLIEMAIRKGGFSKEDVVYLVLTWWNDEFRPLIYIDGNWRTGEKICVFGDIPCNKMYCGLPCGFYIDKNATEADDVVRRPLNVMNGMFYIEDSNPESIRKFMICCSPKNLFVDINPFRTMVMKNHNNENFICLHVDSRDSGEFLPFSRMNENYIKVFDATKSAGKYRYGEWITKFNSD